MICPEYFPDFRQNEFAERRVFEALKKLAHQYDIFYHKKIADYHRLPCEIDFVIFDRNKSILLIEVKGGPISFADGVWKSYDAVIDPLDQILKCKREFIDKYDLANSIIVDYCLWFPDAELSSIPDCLLDYQVFTKIHFEDLALSLKETFKASQENWTNILYHIPFPLEARAYNHLVKRLKGTVSFHIPLHKRIVYEENKMGELAEHQYTIYECCIENRRIIINGVAGSGKTLLALKIAKEYYELGASVLLLSYNIMLGKSFEREASTLQSGPNTMVATSCHAYLRSIIKDKTLYKKADTLQHREEKDEFFELEVPLQICEEIDGGFIHAHQFDVLLIDEAQDFSETILETLYRLAKKDGKIILFKDDKQTIFKQNFIPQAASFFKVRLNKNLRNTKEIIRFINAGYDFNLIINPSNPTGEPVQVQEFTDNGLQLEALERQITHLLKQQQIPPEKLLILYPEKINENHCLYGLDKIGSIPIMELPDGLQREKGTIYFTRIRKFKGLEIDFLLLPNFELFKGVGFDDNYLYTTLTRAKNRLFIYKVAPQPSTEV